VEGEMGSVWRCAMFGLLLHCVCRVFAFFILLSWTYAPHT
jgi:hypothetical protein